jgi:hypothetical protein
MVRIANKFDDQLIKEIHKQNKSELGSFNLFYVWDKYIQKKANYNYLICNDCSFVRYGFQKKYKCMALLTYKEYHDLSIKAKDIDPSVIALKYIADRFELNISQRYWIAFLYGTNYCATTTFLIYNEFPDFENVDLNRLKIWWNKNKEGLIFQTDRLRIKTSNEFIPSYISYYNLTKGNQEQYYSRAKTWIDCYNKITSIKNFGRFSSFNYLDVLNQITPTKYSPTYLNIIEAESCRNGICYAIGKEEWIDKKLTKQIATTLHNQFIYYLNNYEGNIYQIETTLCAYKKYRKGQRYVGYYIERMRNEIEKMQNRYNEGVAWETLWQFREETFDKKYLREFLI